ncbi:Gfo/Idh/MocA family protein [Paenibacillus sp. FSL H8-0034]|uniref:Gfo/Idh/MocA family protein n=1 Tax=Paenibacillus sp. FSL H8-0034 TaxID=2954671 RepID=UPI0030F5F3DA
MTYQRDFKRKLNVAIVGVGSHCYRNILPAMNYLPVTIKALCDRDEALVKATALQYGNCSYYTDAKDMYHKEQLDAVFLAVSPQAHPKLAIEAFEAGVNVWMEKPVAMRAAEVEQMIAHRGENIAVVGLKKAFMPAAEKALEVVHAPEYGGLNSILAVYAMTLPENGKEILESGKFHNWLGNGCHPLAFMMAVGGKVEAVTTHKQKSGNGSLLLDFTNGVAGNFHLARGPQPIESYSLFADKWHMHIDNSMKVTLQSGHPDFKYGVTTDYIPPGFESGARVWEPQNCLATLENKSIFTQGFYHELIYFCECVLNKQVPKKGTLEFALEIMKVYEAALLSDGKTIYV